jgi:hypothetical protein
VRGIPPPAISARATAKFPKGRREPPHRQEPALQKTRAFAGIVATLDYVLKSEPVGLIFQGALMTVDDGGPLREAGSA